MYTVYILYSGSTCRYYIGQTKDRADRLLRHNSGNGKSTKNGRPWILVCEEIYPTRAEAMRREKQIKAYKGGEAFKRLIGK